MASYGGGIFRLTSPQEESLNLMATFQELAFKYRVFMKAYAFSRFALQSIPCTKLTKPLREARVALVTTAGLHLPEQSGFDFSIAGGDASFREIPDTVRTQTLLESHKSDAFDHSGVEADKNLVFPLDRFRELRERGEIGAFNHRHISFMGSITKPQKLIEETAPQAAQKLREDGVEVVFLTPV